MNQCTFAEAFDLQMGKTPSRDDARFWDGNNIWVSIADMKDRKYINSSKEGISDLAVRSTGIRLVPKGTVIMSFKLTIGKVCIADEDLYTNEAIMQFPIKSGYDILPEYLYYYLLGHKWECTNNAVMGATLNKKKLSEEVIIYPSIAEQQRIVDELDLLSGIIEKKNAQLRTLDELASTIFYEMFGDPVSNERVWATRKMKDVAPHKVYSGNIPSKGGKFWLLNLDMVEAQTGRIIEKVLFKPSEIGNSTTKFNEDSILYSKLRPYLNKVVIPDESGYCSNELVPLLPKKEVLERIFLSYLLRSNSFVDYISARVAGAKMPRVTMSDFREFDVILPPLELQQFFSRRIIAIENQKTIINESLASAKELLSGRMDKYFNM